MAIILGILGLVMLYSFIHTVIIHYKAPEHRTQYEKIVSVVGIASASLVILSVMFS